LTLEHSFVAVSKVNIAQFVAFYVSVFNTPPWNDGWSDTAVKERLEAFTAFPTFLGLGCVIDNTAAGLVFGWSERWTQGWHFQIKEMCVAPQYQSQRVGTKLMTAFEGELISRGIKQVYLQTGEKAPARQFYEGLGFSRLPLVSMSKKLIASEVKKSEN
jgi:aminoglycoside 6'-N-acetyltransferase I